MPIAFSADKQLQIKQELQKVARKWLVDTSFQKIKIEDLTKEVGISKGAFYKFYQTKELFFYEILRSLHHEIYFSGLNLLTNSQEDTPEDALCKALICCYDNLEKSEYKRFWLEDSPQIMKNISDEQMREQLEAEKKIFRSYLNRFGELAVEEELAFDAIRALILTVYSRKKLELNYETILRWMAQGVCSRIFK